MNFAVIGSTGQLGRDIVPRLAKMGQVTGLARPDADLTHPDRLAATLQQLKPDVVVNCAAYNFVDKAESEPDAAFAANAWGPRELAKTCHRLGITLVHFSTDYVFGLDTARTTPYRTCDAPGPTSVYGMSKLCGEYGVRAECNQHYVIRTCGLYGVWGSGGKGGNFVETMLRVATQGKPLKVVADQFCTPTYTADLADAVVSLIQTGKYGLYQITSGGSMSWFEFAHAIFELTGISANLSQTTSQEYAAAARRPGYSVMDNSDLVAAGVTAPRHWREALAAYLAERNQKKN
ncbi:MAG: dTDP-4-dehydrorhamnose reductase [Gemmataceae bacterium]